MSTVPDSIQQITSGVSKRWRIQYALAAGVVGVLVVAVVLALLHVVRALTGVMPQQSYQLTFGFTITFGMLAWGYSHKPSQLMSAQLVDRHFQLKGRTASALEFASVPAPDAIRQLQIDEAAQKVTGLKAADVIPVTIPAATRWAAAALLGSIAAAFLPDPAPAVEPAPPAVADVSDAAATLSEQLRQMEEIAAAAEMDDLKEMVIDLQGDLTLLQQSDQDVRQAFAKVSQMQQKMKAMAASLNTDSMDQQLQEVAEALSGAEDFRTAADAISRDDLAAAADALDRLENPELSRQEIEPTSEKLNAAAEAARKKDLDDLAQTLEDLADSVESNDADQMQQNSQKLADDVRQQDTRRKVSQMLTNKAEAFGQAKQMIRAKGNRSGNGGASGKGLNLEKGKTKREATSSSQKAGSKSAGNIDGEKTRLEGQLQMARLKGQLTDEGATEKETEAGGESDETATRAARDVFAEYQKLSDAVLDAEQMPLGHRETIRRYFELIRPRDTDGSSK